MNDIPGNIEFDIAVVGMSCCLPKAKSPEEFWENIEKGRECITFFSDDDLLKKGVEKSLIDHPSYVKAGAIVDDVEMFDAAFFGYSPREVQVMDPQHRLFLETCWKAWEDAGYTSETYSGLVGVFGSTTMNTYILQNLMSHPSLMKSLGPLQMMVGNDKDFLTTRVSYELNLQGPSYAIQTACSSSLTAVHVACNSLLNGECDMALAGGSSIRFPFGEGYMYFEGGTSSPDGHCYAFDQRAKGSVVGNGAGVVVLKRLKEAIKDKDHIYGVIKGSAVSNDGRNKSAFATPSNEGQAKAISAALAIANIPVETVGYVEAHGTGTLVGDPIEFAGLKQAYEAFTDKKQFISLGSVKPNIGHLDAAAGVCGLIKVLLCVKNKKIPPLTNFQTPNPDLEVKNSPFYFNSELKDWNPEGGICRAGVTGIGLGGANAHVIVEEPPTYKFASTDRETQLIPLSAKTESALRLMARNLSGYLQKNPDSNLADVAYTMQTGRQTFAYKMYVCGNSSECLIQQLNIASKQNITQKKDLADPRTLVFMFPGQGSQHVDMLEELYYKEPILKEVVDLCFNLVDENIRRDLQKALIPNHPEDKENRTKMLRQTALAQPALFIFEYALANLLEKWGIIPNLMMGHSVGELVAACLADVFTLEDALKIIVKRGALMGSMQSGKMVSAQISEDQALKYQNDRCQIACINAYNQVVFSGNNKSMKELIEKLEVDKVVFHELNTSHAFHSYMMDKAHKEFAKFLSTFSLKVPTKTFLSNVTGKIITKDEATDPNYWAKHLREPVRFYSEVQTALKSNKPLFLELGPGEVLTQLIKTSRSHLAQEGFEEIHILSSCPKREEKIPSQSHLIDVLGKLWQEGIRINWKKFHHYQRSKLSLPTYPFEKKYFWIEPKKYQKQGENSPLSAIKSSQRPQEVTYNIQTADIVNAFQKILVAFGNRSIKLTAMETSQSPLIEKANVSPSINQPEQFVGIQKQIKEIIQDLLGLDTLSEEQDIKDLGAHSLMLTQLLSRLRETFAIEITMKELFGATKIKDLIALVEMQVGIKNNLIMPASSQSQISHQREGLIKDKVYQIIYDLIGVENLSLEDDLQAHGAHSLMLTQMLSRLRETFAIEITMKELFGATKIKDLIDLIEKHTGEDFSVSKEESLSHKELDELIESMQEMSEDEINQLIKMEDQYD